MKKRLIRFISIIMLISVLSAGLIFNASAESNPVVTFSSNKEDDKLILSLYFSSVSGMIGAKLDLAFDETLLAPRQVTHFHNEENSLWQELIGSEKYIEASNIGIEGEVKYVGVFLEDISSAGYKGGKIHYLDIVFDILPDKASLVNGSEVFLDAVVYFPGQKIPVAETYVIDPDTDPELPAKRLAGDVDNDGKVTATDARRILRYSVSLEDIEKEDIPYANIDFDGNITASDARLALRTSVSLEDSHGHYYTENNGEYLCLYCKKSFILKMNHIHEYTYADCFSTGVCKCGHINNTVRGHVYSDASPVCSVCGLNVGSIKENAGVVLSYKEKITGCEQEGIKAYEKGDWFVFLESSLYITSYYEEIISKIKECDELSSVYAEYMKALKIMDNAIDQITTPAGEIYVSQGNAVKILYARNEAVKAEKQAIIKLTEALEQYGIKAE